MHFQFYVWLLYTLLGHLSFAHDMYQIALGDTVAPKAGYQDAVVFVQRDVD